MAIIGAMKIPIQPFIIQKQQPFTFIFYYKYSLIPNLTQNQIKKMETKFKKIHFVFILNFIFTISLLANSLSTDPNDLLTGTGLFSSPSLGSFTTDPAHITSFLTINSTNVLRLQKPHASDVSFSNGLEYSFTSSKPTHVSFQFSSISTQTEDANLRLIDSATDKTVLLFRAGKAGFIRVNQNQMVSFYNSSISNDLNVTTIKIDISLNWLSQTVNIYVNGVLKGSAKFFQSANSVDKLRLYNLYQSTSYWKNLVVCSSFCYSFNFTKNFLFSSSIIGLIFMLFVLN